MQVYKAYLTSNCSMSLSVYSTEAHAILWIYLKIKRFLDYCQTKDIIDILTMVLSENAYYSPTNSFILYTSTLYVSILILTTWDILKSNETRGLLGMLIGT